MAVSKTINTPWERQRRGTVLIYSVVTMLVLLLIGSLAVDYGRVQLCKSQLQTATDAAARAGAAALSTSVSAAETAAVTTAALNQCDGTAVALTAASDIEFGWYEATTDSFSVLTGSARDSANAIRVTSRRTAARGNPIPLTLTRAAGLTQTDLTTSTIAIKGGGVGGYIGLSMTRMYDSARYDNYNSTTSTGYIDGTAGAYTGDSDGILYSNLDMDLNNSAYIYGSAQYGTSASGGVLTRDSSVTVYNGAPTRLSTAFVFPAVSLGTITTSNDNANITSYRSGTSFAMGDNKGTVTFPGGEYYLTKFDVGKNSTVFFSGKTTIWLDGNSTIRGGNVSHTSYNPAMLQIKMAGSRTITIDDMADVYACIYAPQGDVHHHDSGETYGQVISDLLCFRHTSRGHFDRASATVNGDVVVKRVR